MEAKTTAAVPKNTASGSPEPDDNKAPTKVIPEIAFAHDIKGVCSIAGTLEINSKPRNILNTRTKNNKIICSSIYLNPFLH